MTSRMVSAEGGQLGDPGVVWEPGWPSRPAFSPHARPLCSHRSSVPRCGGAPWGSHRNRSQGQDPRYVTRGLGTHGGNLYLPSGPCGGEQEWGRGAWAQGPVLQPWYWWLRCTGHLSEIPSVGEAASTWKSGQKWPLSSPLCCLASPMGASEPCT